MTLNNLPLAIKSIPYPVHVPFVKTLMAQIKRLSAFVTSVDSLTGGRTSRPMRKKSREMDSVWALEVMDKAPYVTVSMTGLGGEPYAVPLSLARTDERTFYFHSATEGKKLDLLRANPRVCLTAVSKCKPTVGPKDGSFTLEFNSAIAFGRVEEVTNEAEKRKALRAISQRFLPEHMNAFEAAVERSMSRTAVLRITLTEPPVGKRKQYDAHGDELKYGRME